MTTPPQCPWKIRWTFGQDAQCGKPPHTDPHHRARLPNGITVLNWEALDRREFTGDWPGPCRLTPGCILHTGHLRGCAT
jgi:hypothetical protein